MAVLVVWYIQTNGPALAIVSVALAAWLLIATFKEWITRIKLGEVELAESLDRLRRVPRAAHGMTLAHAGLALCIFGFVGSSAWKSEEVLFVETGTSVHIAGFDVTFNGTEQIQGPNYSAVVGILNVTKDGRSVAVLRPERRIYPIAKTQTTEAAIRSTPAGDLYATISPPPNDVAGGKWTLRILYEPLVGFIWLGCMMLVLGGCFSLTDRRLRVGAPRQARRPATAPVPAE